MNVQKWVRRNTKIILGGLVALMALTLVISFSPGGTGGGGQRTVVGQFRDRATGEPIQVSEGELVRAMRQASIYNRWSWFQEGQMRNLYYWRYRQVNPPTLEEAERRKKGWEFLALLREAGLQQVSVAPEEVEQRLRMFFGLLLMEVRDPEQRQQMYERFVGVMFGEHWEVFESYMADVLRVEKLLDLLTEGSFVGYESLYERVLREKRRARVQVVGFDPRDLIKDISPPRPVEVEKHFKEHREDYKVPAKAQVEYLIASIDAYKERAKKPTVGEMEEYYKEHQRQFPKPKAEGEETHAREEGEEEKPEDEFLTFEEARPKVYDRIVARRAKEIAYEHILEVNAALRARLEKTKPEDVSVAELAKEFSSGGPLRHGITAKFDRRTVDDVEKSEELGGGTGLADWAFPGEAGSAPKVHEFSGVKSSTDAGFMIFKMNARFKEQIPDLTEPIRQKITRELAREQLQKRARREVDKIKKIIDEQGLAAAREAAGKPFEASLYFQIPSDPRGMDPSTVGLSEEGISRGIPYVMRSLITARPPGVGQSVVVEGSRFGLPREKQDWIFLIYLEDVVAAPAGEIEEEFRSLWEGERENTRRMRRDKVVEGLMAMASVEDFEKPREEKQEPPAAPPVIPEPKAEEVKEKAEESPKEETKTEDR